MEAMMERVSVEHDRSGTRVRLAGDVGVGRFGAEELMSS
jgi:hypothetical protein